MSKQLLIGFILAYLLLSFVPQLGLMGLMGKGKGK